MLRLFKIKIIKIHTKNKIILYFIGYVALQEAGLTIEKYFASEIDEDAIRISKVNSKGGICHLGRIEQIDENVIRGIGPIDLLIGGSPCVDLSLVNPARKGLFGNHILFIINVLESI